jgi:hypothetical protein
MQSPGHRDDRSDGLLFVAFANRRLTHGWYFLARGDAGFPAMVPGSDHQSADRARRSPFRRPESKAGTGIEIARLTVERRRLA